MQTGRVRVGSCIRDVKLGLSSCFLILSGPLMAGGTGTVNPPLTIYFGVLINVSPETEVMGEISTS
jgi:hypothetical protein